MTASFGSKGRLKISSITVKLSDKSRKLKKKDIRVISSDPAAGTAVIEGSDKNYEGKITVDISSGKLI